MTDLAQDLKEQRDEALAHNAALQAAVEATERMLEIGDKMAEELEDWITDELSGTLGFDEALAESAVTTWRAARAAASAWEDARPC